MCLTPAGRGTTSARPMSGRTLALVSPREICAADECAERLQQPDLSADNERADA
jgi:hypothetical protein